MGGGTFGALHAVDLVDGRRLVAKTAAGGADNLELEGWMLGYLAERSPLPVPAVHAAEPGLLLIDRLEAGGRLDAAAEVDAADHVAALHDVRGIAFGLERDTVIGPLPQANPETACWTDFLRDSRLLPMARAAHAAGRMSGDALARLEGFCGRIAEFVPEPSCPSLLHGDLWTGNVIVGTDGVSGFIDPAIYFGDPEMDLAFATMFGTFGDPFFARYREHRPLDDGFFETRCDICLLWPLLVHARLFGGGYAAQADGILKRFL